MIMCRAERCFTGGGNGRADYGLQWEGCFGADCGNHCRCGVQQGAQAAQDGTKQELLVLEDRLLELYHYDSKACDGYAQAVNAYADWLPEQINMYHMLVPMRIAFEEQQYRQLSDNQQQAIGQVYGQLDSRIRTIDVYTRLEQHQAEPVYFRTDHHWTALGAYYGAQAFLPKRQA